jgi:hypothetical protein
MNTACVYKIFCKDATITDFYVGSTTNMDDRKYRHTLNCNNGYHSDKKLYHSQVYIFIRENGGMQNWDFEILENCDKDELKIKEQHWISTLNPKLNKYRAHLTADEKKSIKQEYRKSKIEYFKEYKKKYYEENREAILAKVKEYSANKKIII